MVATQHGAEFFMQAAMGAEKPQPDSDAGNSQALGNFLRGILQDVAQETNLPEVGRQLGDGTREERAHFAPRIAFLGIFTAGGKLFGKVLAGFRIAGLERNMFGIAPLAKQVDGSVGGDARNPGVQVVLEFILIAGELIEARESLHQRFLPGVFGVGRIPRQPQRAAIQTRRIGHDQVRKCLAVAKPRLRQ